MKALSVRQPWAHAIVHLGKRVENRDWAGCAYRGPVLIHASKTLVVRDFDADVVAVIHATDADPPATLAIWSSRRGLARWRPAQTLPLGGIVGRSRILGTIRDGRPDCPSARSPWYAGGFALVLDNVEPLPFIPWRGSHGFFDVPDEIVAKHLQAARVEPRNLCSGVV